MAVVAINPTAKDSSSCLLQTSIGIWGHKSQAEAEKAGLERGEQRINLYILREALNFQGAPKTHGFGNRTCFSLLTHHVPRFLVFAQSDKRGVAQVIVRCPFGKFDLDD